MVFEPKECVNGGIYMKIVCVIPARYASTRLPGKPLLDIQGKPMIWWVYQQAKKVEAFADVVVATDDERIAEVCEKENIMYCMTRDNHPNHIARVHEVSEKIKADLYVCINGDEPLIQPEMIKKVIPGVMNEEIYFIGAYRKLTDPAETIDSGNIKLVLANDGRCVYMSRGIVPFPKGTLFVDYHKYVGIECFSKKSLDFFVETAMGRLETIEDIDHLRYIENGKAIYFREVESDSISVDTAKDLEKVREMMTKKRD